ncbi:MAG: metallophosphoesterase [Akkermansiaceae bacterium]|nr:metallophosphoesterase [Akkermansiaceae bacterium]
MFRLIFFGIPVLSLLWLVWAMRTRAMREASRAARVALATAVLALLGGYAWIVLQRMDVLAYDPPAVLQAGVLLWGLVALPFIALPSLIVGGTAQAIGAWKRFRNRKDLSRGEKESAPVDESRRRFLAATAVAMPAVATYGLTILSVPQMKHFRVRRIEVPVSGLAKDLDGLRIAHVSDVHVGKFTEGKVLRDLAEATNQLKADVIALTGDLIDHKLADLPEALEMVGRLEASGGVYLVEGNHDLFEGREEFARGVGEAGLPLLINQNAALELRGHPVDLLGIRWARNPQAMAADIQATAALRRSDAFGILLAHHPHAFDEAAAMGIPLTLGGHTHGGQLMLTPEVGPGPMMYRYWSGLYRKAQGQAAVISNGAGNWFPLRTAAPAEIIEVVLKRV